MKVLVACEESQRVCAAFRERGHEAYSCDITEQVITVNSAEKINKSMK